MHVIADAHIYDRHIPVVKKMLTNPQFPAPKLIVNPEVKDFYKFTVDDFTLVDYKYNKIDEKFEVAV